ncbi:MAG: endo-1,4-beta-xylanase [Gemmataceae bacterium]
MSGRWLWLSAVVACGLVGWASAPADEAKAPADPLAGAAARIEKHRKGGLTVEVVDAAGKPVADARVAVEQTRHAFLFGCNLFLFDRAGDAKDTAAYRARFRDTFNFATLPFYWFSYQAVRDKPEHDRIAAMARWCKENGIVAKGHPLAWNYAEPRWLPDDPDAVLQLQMERVSDLVTRFRGLVDTWDVVNEATHFDRDDCKKQAPKLTAAWAKVGRVEFVRDCFAKARPASRAATLLINDYRVDADYAKLIDRLTELSGKRPFDVIGLQSHMHGGTWDNRKLWEVCERFARFKVPLHFTELTVLSGKNGWELAKGGKGWPSTAADEERQAREVERIYTMLFSHPAVQAITWWDLADRGAWMRAPAGLIRADLSPKPAYDRLHRLVKERWWTRATAQTDNGGQVRLRAFHGEHRVTVKVGERETSVVAMVRPGDNKVTVRLP